MLPGPYNQMHWNLIHLLTVDQSDDVPRNNDSSLPSHNKGMWISSQDSDGQIKLLNLI